MSSIARTAQVIASTLRFDPLAAAQIQATIPPKELVTLLGLDGYVAEQLAEVAQQGEARKAKVSALLTATDAMLVAIRFHEDFSGEEAEENLEKAREAFANEPNHPTDIDGFPEILRLAAEERRRQVLGEKFSLAHDDLHDAGELALAAAAYLVPPLLRDTRWWGLWPWSVRWWKPTPKDRRRELVKAVALIVAEDQRLLRAESAYVEVNGRRVHKDELGHGG